MSDQARGTCPKTGSAFPFQRAYDRFGLGKDVRLDRSGIDDRHDYTDAFESTAPMNRGAAT